MVNDKDNDYKVTLEDAKEIADNAMGNFWGPDMDDLRDRLEKQFPTKHKSIAKIFDWAGDASVEREEPMNGEAFYERMWWNAINGLERLFKGTKPRK